MNDLGAPSGSVVPAPPGRNRRLWLLSGIAGAAVIVLVLAFLFWPRGADPAATSATGSSSTAPAAGPSPSPAATTTATGTPSPTASVPPTGTPSGAAAPSTQAPAAPSTAPHVAGVSTLGSGFATGIVNDAGITVPGDVQQAVQWTDANGRNILLAATRVDHRRGDGDADAGTVTVMLVAHVDTGAKVLRTMTDSGSTSAAEPCPTDFGTVVLPGSLTVRDDDGDGVGEATVAWFVACRGDVGLEPIRLALLSGGKKFILRGLAVPKSGPGAVSAAEHRAYGLPAGSYTADPKKSAWPKNSFARADQLFHQLFR